MVASRMPYAARLLIGWAPKLLAKAHAQWSTGALEAFIKSCFLLGTSFALSHTHIYIYTLLPHIAPYNTLSTKFMCLHVCVYVCMYVGMCVGLKFIVTCFLVPTHQSVYTQPHIHSRYAVWCQRVPHEFRISGFVLDQSTIKQIKCDFSLLLCGFINILNFIYLSLF